HAAKPDAMLCLVGSEMCIRDSMNILVVLLGIVCGVVLYKEKLKLPTILGTILGISGLVCLALAMK
ncbi:EamA family transporter, partial [Acinetobacter baumannii]